jgi:hypothetical protein
MPVWFISGAFGVSRGFGKELAASVFADGDRSSRSPGTPRRSSTHFPRPARRCWPYGSRSTTRSGPPRFQSSRPSASAATCTAVRILSHVSSAHQRRVPVVDRGPRPEAKLTAFLIERCRLAPPAGSDAANELLGRTVYPRLLRTLLGVEAPLDEESDEASLAADIDLAPIRDAVTALVPSGEVGTP